METVVDWQTKATVDFSFSFPNYKTTKWTKQFKLYCINFCVHYCHILTNIGSEKNIVKTKHVAIPGAHSYGQ